MSIAASDLILYSSANTPEDDTSTSGGAIDATSRPVLTQLSSNAQICFVSDGADTRGITVKFRNAAGAVVTETPSLNGAVEVLTSATAERILSITLGSSSGTRTVTIKQGSGGSTLATIPPNEVKVHISFQQSASSTGSLVRYEKTFWKNAHATLTLNSAAVKLTADPVSKIKIGLAAAVNGSTSVANRLAVPGSVSFVDDNVSQSVPSGVLAAGDAIGTWIEQTLDANDTAQRSTFTTELSGSSV
jgi:hypothetical protein